MIRLLLSAFSKAELSAQNQAWLASTVSISLWYAKGCIYHDITAQSKPSRPFPYHCIIASFLIMPSRLRSHLLVVLVGLSICLAADLDSSTTMPHHGMGWVGK